MTFTLSVVPLATILNGVTLYEKIDYDMLSALQSSDLMIAYDNWSYDNGFSHERDHLAKYMTIYKKKHGLFAVEYTRGKRTIGRPHVKANLGMWCVARKSRNTLMRHLYYDIDIKNAHPMIIYGLLQNAKYDVKKRFPYFSEYCEKRKEKIQYTMDLFKCDEKTAKNAFIRIMYNGDIEAWKNDKNVKITHNCDPTKEKFYDGFKEDVSRIIDIFIEKNTERYEKDCDTYRKDPKNKGKKNERGSFFSNCIQDYETKIISHLVSYIMSNTNITKEITKEGIIHILTYAADGFMVLKERIDALEGGLQGFLEDMIQMTADFCGLDLEFIAKDINDPTDYHTEFKYTPPVVEPQIDEAAVKKEQKEREKEQKQEEKKKGEEKGKQTYKAAFEKMKKEFEKTNFKVDEISCYVQETIDEEFKRRLIPRNPSELKIAFSHLKIKYTAFEKNKMVDKVEPFIPAWIDCEDIRRYERMDCYPDAEKCPKNVFNIWSPFAMERFYPIKSYTPDEEFEIKAGVETLRNHLSIMCNHNKEDLLEFEKWIAQMIQFPDTKSFMPIFQSGEGSGKGSFVQLMAKILGGDKVVLTANPEEDVVGRFNNMMETAFLVFMDEISKQVTNGVIDKLKNVVTEPTIRIQHKGKGSYPMKSFHRLGGLTNVWDAGLTITKGARRWFVVSMSDEKKGDTAYWNRFYSLLEKEHVLLGFYDYYKKMKVDRKLTQPRTTEFAKELMTLSVDVPTLWLTDMIRDARVNKATYTSNAELSKKYKTIGVTDANGKVENRYVVELYGGEACKMLLEWCEENGYKRYETNSVKLGVYLSRKKFDGITKGRGLEKGDTKYYDVEKLYTELTKE
jgi:hypothetical protein